MPDLDTSARSTASYDWSATTLGDAARWPLPLRLASDLLLNSPLPTLLVWGQETVLVFNEAYGALAGPGYGRVPGGSVPPVLPPPLAAAGANDALNRAWRGEAQVVQDAALAFRHPGETHEHRFDLRLSPVRDDSGAVRGVLLALAPPTAAPVQEDAGDASLRILVVEDNIDSQYLVCEMLKAFGHEADGVAHPDDALALLASRSYDVLFSDVSLPGMSGVELAQRAVADKPALRVIFASGYGDTLLRHLTFPYLSLQKPYELNQLQDALAKVARQAAA
ncbi:response regulator [Massilia sp. YIM B02443]|uniref:response regulator n=1 Tax=Massilia sp. YIM B02443 TaxID=3050127 RepID=UPI0025B6BC83|nr:response regulator [Massilia sp. YIM B02443]MDN4039642.1 response regulator [Massilia sp. YIM B02443]